MLQLLFNWMLYTSSPSAHTTKKDGVEDVATKNKKVLKKPPSRGNQTNSIDKNKDSDIDASDEELYKAAAAASNS